MGLDVKVLKDDQTEVEIMETSEYGDTDLNAIIAGDRNFAFEDEEPLSDMGFSKQEFDENEELVAVEEDESEENEEDGIFGDFDVILDEE